jgi:hypothetical protein
LTRDKVCAVLRFVRRLLVTLLAAWLPLFAGSAAAAVICKSHSLGQGFGHHAHEHESAPAIGHHGAADVDDQGCDACYAHCALWLPASTGSLLVPLPGAVAMDEVARLISLSFPPAHRPPLTLQG